MLGQGAFFINHTVDEQSPLFDRSAPNNISFKGVIRIFLTVDGIDVPGQECQSGTVDMGLDAVVINGRWQDVLSGGSASDIDLERFEGFEPLPRHAWLLKAGVQPPSNDGDAAATEDVEDARCAFGLPEVLG